MDVEQQPAAAAPETVDLSWLELLPPKDLKPLCEEKDLGKSGNRETLAKRLRANDGLSKAQLKVLCEKVGVANKQGSKADLAQRIGDKLRGGDESVGGGVAAESGGADGGGSGGEGGGGDMDVEQQPAAAAPETVDLSWLELLPPKDLKPLCEEKDLGKSGNRETLAKRLRANDGLSKAQLKVLCEKVGVANKQGSKADLAQRIGDKLRGGEAKKALVVGISDYPSSPLTNPVNDAKAVAKKLTTLGFDVDMKLDCSEEEFTAAHRNFTDALSNDVACAVFYFAGHGCEYQNRNYLITTTPCTNDRDLPRKAVDAMEVQRGMEESGCKFPVIILDCCRSFRITRSTRASLDGMAEMKAVGSYIALACAPNKTAEDGSGANGTFTAALLKHIGTPDLDIDRVFRRVRVDVLKATNDEQEPWTRSSLRVDPACLCP